MSTESAHTLPSGLPLATAELRCASRNRQPTRRGPARSWRSGGSCSQGSSSRFPVRREELFHCRGNFNNVRLYSKMPGIQDLDARIRYIASKCFRPVRHKERVVLTPNREQRRLSLPKVILKCRIELHVRCVIEKQIQLNVFVPRALQQSRIQRV